MITWGISANSHDAALAVFDNNNLIFASHSERFSGIKNDANLCDELINYASKFGNPSKIYWYERPLLKSIRQLVAGQGLKFDDNNIKKYLSTYHLNVPITYTAHHHSHAAAGYYTSSFADACILVIDAIGEFETMTIWHGTGNKLKKIWSQNYPNSIGLFYSAMTQRVGLKPNEDEYILMGMAAYGGNKLEQRIYDDFVADNFKFRRNLHRGCLDWAPDLTVSDYFDIASGTQLVYNRMFKDALELAKKLVPSDNLVFMGGCALNCSANPLAYKYFNNVWIMPNPGDAGSAIGTVLAHTKNRIRFNPYIGYDIGYHSTNAEIVEYLIANQVCGIARGKAEFGPRALGNRSLIADPRVPNIKDRVNTIKDRQAFRPFAPMVLEEHASEHFDLISTDNRYMQYTATCKYPDKFPGIVHADGTSRVQTVGKNADPQVRTLLEEWYSKTGCPMLLNTSLNIKGHPMVNTIGDSKVFENTYNVKVFN
jgi:carbamoyltransferase